MLGSQDAELLRGAPRGNQKWVASTPQFVDRGGVVPLLCATDGSTSWPRRPSPPGGNWLVTAQAAQKKVPFGWKGSPELGKATPPFPSLEKYASDVRDVVRRMRAKSRSAPILILSVPPLGDRVADFGAADEAGRVDEVVRATNAKLRTIVADAGDNVHYLPFFERCEARLRLLGATTPYAAATSNQLVTDVTKGRAVHAKTFDAIGEGLGLLGCCDMIHPTEQTIFAVMELVEARLSALLPVAEAT